METLDGRDIPSPREVAELLRTAESVFGRLAEADLGTLTAGEQFAVLGTLETVDAIRAAVRGQAAVVFEDGRGYDELGFGGLTSTVQGKLKVTRGKIGRA